MKQPGFYGMSTCVMVIFCRIAAIRVIRRSLLIACTWDVTHFCHCRPTVAVEPGLVARIWEWNSSMKRSRQTLRQQMNTMFVEKKRVDSLQTPHFVMNSIF